jgi:hypothetical protein
MGETTSSSTSETNAALATGRSGATAESATNPTPICPCGCGQAAPKQGRFVPGHDQMAIHQRIKQEWGNTIGFIEWFDTTYGFEGG